jgi:hypothetical protein
LTSLLLNIADLNCKNESVMHFVCSFIVQNIVTIPRLVCDLTVLNRDFTWKHLAAETRGSPIIPSDAYIRYRAVLVL